MKVVLVILAFLSQLLSPIHLRAEDFVLEKDITYGQGDGVDLKLDLARPETGTGPFPVLVYLFGNGWGFWPGSKKQYQFAIMQAAQKGYVAVAVDFRQTSIKEKGKTKYPFPAQLYDVKCAVRWLRAHAEAYNLDPEHIGVAGWSSGGHLALLLGLTVPSDGLEGECGDPGYSSRVQAVVNSAGPADLAGMFNESMDGSGPIAQLLGGTPQQLPEAYAEASPLYYVRKDAPPILTIHGEIDRSVPVKQSFLLDAMMKEAGAPHTLIIRKIRGHEDYTTSPEAWDFFDKYLKGKD